MKKVALLVMQKFIFSSIYSSS